MTYWCIKRRKEAHNCGHRWLPFFPFEKEQIEPGEAFYRMWLREVCEACGEQRKREIGVMSEGHG